MSGAPGVEPGGPVSSAKRCRRCGSSNVRVVDGRARAYGGIAGGRRGAGQASKAALAAGLAFEGVARRHACDACGWRFNTVEIREADLLRLLKGGE